MRFALHVHSRRVCIEIQLSDIVKVRLQTSTRYSSALDGATQIFKNEGPAAFYKVGIHFASKIQMRFLSSSSWKLWRRVH